MNERLPDDVFAKSATVVHRHIILQPSADVAWHWGVFKKEALRARDAEAAQFEQIRQKDEQIKALADALERARDLLPNSFANAARVTIEAALAKAGRKP